MANLKEAIEYASKNPQSDFAKALTVRIQSGMADQEAQSLGIDLNPVKRMPAPTMTPTMPTTPEPEKPGFFKRAVGAVVNTAKAVGNALTYSEQEFGKDIAGAIGGHTYATELENINKSLADSDLNYIKNVKANRDKAMAEGRTADVERYNNVIGNFSLSDGTSIEELFPAIKKTNGQVVGDAAGVLLDALSAGTYGNAAKGAKTGELLTKSARIAAQGTPVATQVAKKSLSETLKVIGKETGKRAVIGGATGYGYDVASNLQEGDTGVDALKPGFGTALGAGIPVVIGGIRAASAITKDQAPRIINSLIKPKEADFSYGKDPGRTVAEMGITGNNLEDFGDNIHRVKTDLGTKIGDIYKSEANAALRIDVSDEVAKIDDAIKEAAKGGKNNQGIVTNLQNIKDSLLYQHTINAEGNIVKAGRLADDVQKTVQNHLDEIGQEIAANPQAKASEVLDQVKKNIVLSLQHAGASDVADEINKIAANNADDFSKAVTNVVDTPSPLKLSDLTPEEAFQFKKEIAARTQFTGKPSDDKTVNAVLKDIYGGTKEKLNSALSKNNPEIIDLNQKYADLTSAELATRHRGDIIKRQNLISMPIKVGSAAAIITSLSGGTAVPVILAGAGAAALDKALASTAVKSRVAAWLGSQKPSAVAAIIQQNPAIKEVLYRVWPKLASQIKLPDEGVYTGNDENQ